MVDVRMGDHYQQIEDRYRRFGMSDEQARLYYSFKKTPANAYSCNYAYKKGQLDSAIAYARNAITTRVETNGDRLFVIDLTADGAPTELKDPFNRITVKNALQNSSYTYPIVPAIPDKAKVTLSLMDNLLLVRVNVPTYRIRKLEMDMPSSITFEVEGTDFSSVEPLELKDKIRITPSYATKQQISWKSFREKVVKVDQNGKLTVVGFGTTRIWASTCDGSGLKRNINVTVKQKKAG